MTTNTLLASLLLALGAAGPAAAGPDVVHDIAFSPDRSTLHAASAQQLDTVARWLRRHPGMKLVLEGHADSTGTAGYDEELAARRADMVRMHLIGHGISSDRILVVVYGEATAKPDASSIDRRVVLSATAEPLDTVAERLLEQHRARHATWTRKGVLFTQSHTPRAREGRRTVATR